MTPRLALAEGWEAAGLLLPARLAVFAEVRALVTRGKRRGQIDRVGLAWQGWNASPTMEARMARLPGAGSFYWPAAFVAVRAARRIMREDPAVHQIKIETIGGREIGRLYR